MSDVDRARIDGLELAYGLQGTGEPVVLIHWGVSGVWAEPLLEQQILAGRHRMLWYHRPGFGHSAPVEGGITMAEHAEHCRLLMRQLDIERAHVVGHSSSALIALELALAYPDAVQTLVLMEPARPNPTTEAQAAFMRDVVLPAVERHGAGNIAGAVETWCAGVFGDGYRETIDRGLPGLFESTVEDADTFFTQELPAVAAWTLEPEDAARITQPVLAVRGERTAPTFPERLDLLASWLPNVEHCVLPGSTHLLHLENPGAAAEALSSFFARHPS